MTIEKLDPLRNLSGGVLLDKIKEVDGSGPDADMMDGQRAGSFVQQNGSLNVSGQAFGSVEQFDSFFINQYELLTNRSVRFLRASVNFSHTGKLTGGVWLVIMYKDDADYGAAFAFSYRSSTVNKRLAIASHIPSGWTDWEML